MRLEGFVGFSVLALVVAFLVGRYTSPHSADAVRALSLQKTCAESADKYVRERNRHDSNEMATSTRNHYNTRIGKCLVLESSNDFLQDKPGNKHNLERLTDVFDKTDMGIMMQVFQGDESESNTAPLACAKYADGVNKVHCKSYGEWTTYVNKMLTE